MAGELLIQGIDVGRFRAIAPMLDEIDAARTLGPAVRALLVEAAASPFVASERHRRLAELLGRILRYPALELRVFLSPGEVDEVIERLVQVLCFENGAEASLIELVGPNWVVLDDAFAAFMDIDWFQDIFLDSDFETAQLAHPRRGETRYQIVSRNDIGRLAAGLWPMPASLAAEPEARSAAEGLAHLVDKALSGEELTLAYTSLL
jgi:hypothetical protein